MAEALVEYDYKARELDELTIKKGDIITNISFKPGGWWEGTLLNGGKRGMFPDNFVKLIKNEDGAVPNSSSSGRRCKVLFPYAPEKEDELELQVGDVIDIIAEVEEGWWKGSLKSRVGVFPSNFVAEITDVKPERQEAAVRKSKISRDESLKHSSGGMNSSGSNSESQTSLKPESTSDLPVLPPKPERKSRYSKVWTHHSLDSESTSNPLSASNLGERLCDTNSEMRGLTKSETSRDIPALPPKIGKHTVGSNLDSKGSFKAESSSHIPALPPKIAKEYCRVMYKYEAKNADELTLHRGDVITIITKEGQDPGWWKGELKGKVGVFPDNFVELITPEEATKTELKTKVTNRLGMAISKSATTSSISDTLSLTSLSRKLSDKNSDDKIPPSVGKKPVLPPPPGKKPSPSAKVVENSQSGQTSGKVITSSTTSIKHGNSVVTETSTVSSTSSKWTVHEPSDNADGPLWSKQSSSYSLKSDKKTPETSPSSITALSMINTESNSDLNLDMVGRSSKKLTHPTATRAKAPKRRPPSMLLKDELKNGAEDSDDDEEEETAEETLLNGDADSHVEKVSNAPPWVEELKLSQAKKSLQTSMQGKTRVVIGMSSSTSERSISEKSVSEKTVSERIEKVERSEKAHTEKMISEKVISPESRQALVTLRQQPITGQRPQSMISNFRPSSSPPLYQALSSDSITLPLKQWNDLLEKVSVMESNIETLMKAVKDLTGKLDEEQQKRTIMQQELEKLTDIVTQV